ncbi:putative ATP/GTP-binding protein [Streptomyces himastatinicus ATCC 53653]|uniref:Putative ATP/GTP-binding protein n=2 Tax=Streptomyces violaceusniger group TaxID=2839105 RepID=D9WT66_9ACTN|nr:putative ATP/GTP-binding protein [Streptomyces himastatinicus ATCC 53653]
MPDTGRTDGASGVDDASGVDGTDGVDDDMDDTHGMNGTDSADDLDDTTVMYVQPSVAGAAKILVVGPMGVGKTTLIGTVSEIKPLSTEATMSRAGARLDMPVRPTKSTTTVALDFGRITLGGELVLYLFGTPGQQRFLPAWKDLARGALGALALVDTRDLEASFDAIGHLEDLDVPFSVAVNSFPDSVLHSEDDLRSALDLLPHTPLVICDAREHKSSVKALISLVSHLIETVSEAT